LHKVYAQKLTIKVKKLENYWSSRVHRPTG